jgi:hypothetical protein
VDANNLMKIFPCLFLALIGLAFFIVPIPSSGLDPAIVLKRYDYKHLTLLAISKNKKGQLLACFYGRDANNKKGEYQWVAESSEFSTRNATIRKIQSDHIEIEEIIGVNGVDWVSAVFKWPVAKNSDQLKLKAHCALPPN